MNHAYVHPDQHGQVTKNRFFASELNEAHDVVSSEELMQDSEDDDDNQDDSEFMLADADNDDFNEMAAETSSLGSSDSIGFACSEDQRTFTAVRVRPMLPSEKKNGYRPIVDMTMTGDGLMTRIVNPTALPPLPRSHASARYTSNKLPSGEPSPCTGPSSFPAQFTQEFRFDYAFWSFDRSLGHQVATQSTIYDELGVLALQTLFQGSNCSIFAYGQPSSGKTFSMMGSSGERAALPASARTNSSVSVVRTPSALSRSEQRGFIPRICQGIFAEIDETEISGASYTAMISYVEIYDERVYDLLAQTSIKGAFVEGAKCVHVMSYSQILELIEEGNLMRSVPSSHGTSRPTRSHIVLTISLSQKSLADSAPRTSKLCMVDLAASERVDHSDVSGLSVRQAGSVNRSLATLADVVGALAKRRSSRSVDGSQYQKTFAPYRNSVLTRLLKDCLAGHAKTIILGAISPCCVHYEESIATLRYIERARSVYSTIRMPVEDGTGGDTVQNVFDDAGELECNLRALKSCVHVSLNCYGSPENCDDYLECNSDERCQSIEKLRNSLANEQKVPGMEIDATEQESIGCVEECDIEAKIQVDITQEKLTTYHELQRSVHLLNLVAIRRRTQALRKYRALDRWRNCAPLLAKSTHKLKEDNCMIDSCGLGGQSHNKLSPQRTSDRKAGCPPLHTRTKPVESCVPDVIAAVVTTDAICCSVVQEFLFPRQPNSPKLRQSATVSSASLLELLASSSEYDRTGSSFHSGDDCSDTEQLLEDLASSKRRYSSEEEKLNSPNVTTDAKGYSTISVHDSTLSPSSLEPLCEDGSIHSTLSLCVDSIDMARRALGPGLHHLKRLNKGNGVASGVGVECELLKCMDKKFIAMTRSLEELMASLQPFKSSKPSYELLESMVGEFCLQIVAKLCDQLPSASSGCSAGRIQLEKQVEHFSDRLTCQLLPEIARTADALESDEVNFVIVVATDMLIMTERIKLAWNFVGHRRRERLLQLHAQELAAIKDRKMAVKITALEVRNAELAAKCKELLTISGASKDPISNDFELSNGKTTNRALAHTAHTLEQLEKECEAHSIVSRDDSIGAKLAVEVARTRDVQARNDELLCRFATLNRALAAASARVTALETENSRLNNGRICSIGNGGVDSPQACMTSTKALNDRIIVLQKELECARDYTFGLERQLATFKGAHEDNISDVENMQSFLSREKEARREVASNFKLIKAQSNALITNLKQQLVNAEDQEKELLAATSSKLEEKWLATKATLIAVQARNTELSTSLITVMAELHKALENTSQVEYESLLHITAINVLKDSLAMQKERTDMAKEDSVAAQLALRNCVSDQSCEISLLKQRLLAVVQDRDEHILLLSRTEEALANALDREKKLQIQLETSSSREEQCLRAKLHESALEISSLREKLTELLDHSTLQSATIEDLQLKEAKIAKKCLELEIKCNKLVLRYRHIQNVIEQKDAAYQEYVRQADDKMLSLTRQLESERQECMNVHEALQRESNVFHKLMTQQHAIKMNYCCTIRDLKAQVELLSTKTYLLEEELKTTKEIQKQKEDVVQEQEKLVSKVTKQLHECQIDLSACIRRWVHAETQSVLQRVSIECLTRYLIGAQETCMMQLADVESSRLSKARCVRATPEIEQATKEQLSSIDAWFDEVVSGNQAMSEDTYVHNTSVHKIDIAGDKDFAARSSLLKTLTGLSTLTRELLAVCESTPKMDNQSICSTAEPNSPEECTSKPHRTEVLQEISTQSTNAHSESVQLR
ncbi:unnamed protein product [Phytophthora fragariaefolia]|uniref:Unnamed protein product n=1 Tax=Phytophthora fragariaefolia TaxID=1490495 RepID=A0A9W6YLP3_9STRA|nr:unnamed protein product [Phytophthora fragariaefolia]